MKKVALAGFLNFFCPGVGYIYAGRRVGFGVTLFFSALLWWIGAALTGNLMDLVPITTDLLVWINAGFSEGLPDLRFIFMMSWALCSLGFAVDASNVAVEINAEHQPSIKSYKEKIVD